MKVFRHIITNSSDEQIRLSDYLIGVFPLLTSRKSIKKAFIRNEIFVDGLKGHSGAYIKNGQVVEHRKMLTVSKKEISLNVIYEDEFMLVVNKPPGMKSSGQGAETIEMALVNYGCDSDQVDALLAPQLIHRLDRDTTGLLIAAKTKKALDILSSKIAKGEIYKEYIAIVEGIPEVRFIEKSIDDKYAKTELVSIVPLETKDITSFLSIRLHTGRTHQIRKHLLSIGCPIIGDNIYNINGVKFGRGLFLQAHEIILDHPITDEKMVVYIKPHKKFEKYINCNNS